MEVIKRFTAVQIYPKTVNNTVMVELEYGGISGPYYNVTEPTTEFDTEEEAIAWAYSENESGTKSFDYLVRMPLISLSLEKIRELENHRDTRQTELNDLQSKTERDLWKNDLQDILKMLL